MTLLDQLRCICVAQRSLIILKENIVIELVEAAVPWKEVALIDLMTAIKLCVVQENDIGFCEADLKIRKWISDRAD